MLFLLESPDVMVYTKWFLNVEPALHTWNKSHLVMVYNNSFDMLLDLFANIFLQNCAFMLPRDTGL